MFVWLFISIILPSSVSYAALKPQLTYYKPKSDGCVDAYEAQSSLKPTRTVGKETHSQLMQALTYVYPLFEKNTPDKWFGILGEALQLNGYKLNDRLTLLDPASQLAALATLNKQLMAAWQTASPELKEKIVFVNDRVLFAKNPKVLTPFNAFRSKDDADILAVAETYSSQHGSAGAVLSADYYRQVSIYVSRRLGRLDQITRSFIERIAYLEQRISSGVSPDEFSDRRRIEALRAQVAKAFADFDLLLNEIFPHLPLPDTDAKERTKSWRRLLESLLIYETLVEKLATIEAPRAAVTSTES